MNVASSQGNRTSLMNCANACKKLKLKFFGDDIQQYRLLPDYVFKLRQNDHDVIFENGRQTIHSNANCISRRESSVQVIRTTWTLSRWYFSQKCERRYSFSSMCVEWEPANTNRIRGHCFYLKMKLIGVSFFGIWA
uniref:AlNc14C227G9231 protein n=1 Tax=Albugo laibachii Nc14 TaxID=890382 RepID=F0WS92_9STRA|nr:AlNc14C227G9231 [Albugo laibachii Nc14]|eukprot:CCA24211.1 AlNc14C227G9231 [Albugo laibachii Nc14]